MIEEIRSNIKAEMKMTAELSAFIDKAAYAPAEEKKLLEEVIESLKKRIKILNDSNGAMMRKISLAKKLPGKSDTGMEKIESQNLNIKVALKSEDKEKFLQELSISEGLIKRLKKRNLIFEKQEKEFTKANGYARLSNKIFFTKSKKFVEKGSFKDLINDLKKSNMNIMAATYLSMMFFTMLLSLLAGIILAVVFLFVNVGTTSPFISFNSAITFGRILKTFWLIPALPVLTFAAFYLFPNAEQKSLAGKIDSELPFVVIHMGSISASGIEPTQIFRIVGMSKDYKHTRGEVRKLLNQINVYGYDLVTALKNVASVTPSARFAELLNGLSTTITSGGDMKTFFEKRAETLLLNYRLEREKFAKVAETFMDIYISVVIATPMILLLLLVMISVAGLQAGPTLPQLTLIVIVAVAVVNIIFLWLLSLKQPSY